jgi:uncharacterized protein involved in response to NO
MADQHGATVKPGIPAILLVARERQHTSVLRAYVIAGLAFMLLPGTFLGVWNLISISGQHGSHSFSAAWIQAHGHAQIFGWIGTFILGIGFYSLPAAKKAGLRVAKLTFALWIVGVALRWATNIYAWHWRLLLPASALLELGAFCFFYYALRGHRPAAQTRSSGAPNPGWIMAVLLGTFGFGAILILNAVLALAMAIGGRSPAFPHLFEQRYLAIATWAFIVPTVWGFSARWVPVFIGTPRADESRLKLALAVIAVAALLIAVGQTLVATGLFAVGAGMGAFALNIFRHRVSDPKVKGVDPRFPLFVQIAYIWMLVAAVIGVAAAMWDMNGGVWGASRHALTVGFFATMVFSIGQRVLPHFAGVQRLFSTRMMLASVTLLSAGCLIRVIAEILAYEEITRAAWLYLPVSAVAEMAAVTLFAANILLSITLSPSAFVDTHGAPQHRAV